MLPALPDEGPGFSYSALERTAGRRTLQGQSRVSKLDIRAIPDHIDKHQLGQIERRLATLAPEDFHICRSITKPIGGHKKLIFAKVVGTSITLAVEVYGDNAVWQCNLRQFFHEKLSVDSLGLNPCIRIIHAGEMFAVVGVTLNVVILRQRNFT